MRYLEGSTTPSSYCHRPVHLSHASEPLPLQTSATKPQVSTSAVSPLLLDVFWHADQHLMSQATGWAAQQASTHILPCKTSSPAVPDLSVSHLGRNLNKYTLGIEVNPEVGNFFPAICPLVEVRMYAIRSSHEKRKAAAGKNDNRNSERKW